MEDSLKKFFSSTIVEVKRSEIHPADYNPRKIDEQGKRMLKRSMKQFGVVGGIIVNSQTGNTIVGGHQKVAILDEMYKYPDNDYSLRVEMISVDRKTEKTLNIALNNGNISGSWDYDALARLVPDIDYKDAGLTDADLNMIGCDFLLQTEEENSLAGALEEMMQPVTERKEAEKAARQLERAEKVAHMKDVKQQVKEQAQETAANMDAYLMLSFDTWDAKAAFCERFGYNPYMKFIKGEVFDEQVERVE
jgi:hypothetical protein